jgi:polysaccharide pyruvyl transferase WcaK-like protein
VARFARALQESDILLTSRLHGVMIAARTGMPCVAIGVPGEKVARECRALGSQAFLSYETGSNPIVEAVREQWDQRDSIARTIAAGVDRQERLARETFRVLGNPEFAPLPAGRSAA